MVIQVFVKNTLSQIDELIYFLILPKIIIYNH